MKVERTDKPYTRKNGHCDTDCDSNTLGDYYYMKDGIFGFSLIEYYKMNLLELINYSVLPDFFIFRMEMKKFKKLLEDRKYMMRIFKKLMKIKNM